MSLYSFSLHVDGAEWKSSASRDRATQKKKDQPEVTHYLSSMLPVCLAGYASQRVSIQFSRCETRGVPFTKLVTVSPTEPSASVPLKLTIYTSRRVQTLKTVAAVNSFEDWARSVVYFKDFGN